jgi:hypothetical protein
MHFQVGALADCGLAQGPGARGFGHAQADTALEPLAGMVDQGRQGHRGAEQPRGHDREIVERGFRWRVQDAVGLQGGHARVVADQRGFGAGLGHGSAAPPARPVARGAVGTLGHVVLRIGKLAWRI